MIKEVELIEYTMGVCSRFKLEHEEQRGKEM